jgi:hypothetical protein
MENDMMRTAIALTLLLGTLPGAQASPGNPGTVCVARVLLSEELPYAPMGYWLVRVTLQITPPGGPAYQTTLHDTMPWQGPPPRQGQVFRVLCDPANPGDLHLL